MQFTLAQVLSLVVGVVLPLLSGLVTRSAASEKVRATVLLALSALTSFFLAWSVAVSAGQAFNVVSALIVAVLTWTVGVTAHHYLWLPSGLADAVQAIGGFIGKKRDPPPATLPPATPPGPGPTG